MYYPSPHSQPFNLLSLTAPRHHPSRVSLVQDHWLTTFFSLVTVRKADCPVLTDEVLEEEVLGGGLEGAGGPEPP